MASAGVEVGTGYITIVPSAQGFLGKLQSQVAPAAATAGADAGKKMGGGISGGLGAVASGAGKLLAPIGAALATVEVGKFFGDAVDEAREAEKVGKTTAQIIKATGGAAKVSADQVGELAGAISAKSGMDDEAIQSGMNLLLTFKNVRNEVGAGANIFDRASQAAVDLSAAGFGSVEGASKMLGKALNDPVKGISALGRAGVTFTEQQKDQIKTLVASGETLEAQKLIMKEVESQVGGVAAANATASEKMEVAWGNFKENIGTKLLPVLDAIQMFMVDKVLPAATDLAGGIEGLFKLIFEGDYTGALADIFGWEEDHPLIRFILDLREGFLGMGDSTQGPMAGVMRGAEGIRGALEGMWAAIQPILAEVWAVIRDQWTLIEPTVKKIFDNMRDAVNDAMVIVKSIIELTTSAIKFIWDTWGTNIIAQIRIIMDTVSGVFQGASDVIGGIFRTLASILTGDWKGAREGLEQITRGLFTVLESLFRGAVQTLGNVWDGIKNVFAGPVNWVVNNVINPLIDSINGLAKTFGINLGLRHIAGIATSSSSSGSASSKGNQRAMRGGGILDGFRPFALGDDQMVAMRSGEGVYVSEAMKDPYERARLYGINRLALAGRSLKSWQQAEDSSFAHLAGGGIVPNATQGFRGYNPSFLGAIKAWADATGRTWHMTGIGGARDYATQKAAYLRWLSGTGPLAANPDRGGPHMIPANAMDLSPRPGDIGSARGLLGAFGLGLPVRGEPWHVGWAGGGRQGQGVAAGGLNLVATLKDQLMGMIGPLYSGAGVMGQIMNGVPKWLVNSAAGKIKSLFGFDEGGWMMPGSFGFNGLREPEAVLTPPQFTLLRDNLRRAGVVNNNVFYVTIPAKDLEEMRTIRSFFDALELESLTEVQDA